MSKDYGIRISQKGHDVKTCTDPETVFSSKFDNLKIHTRGTGTIYDSTGRTHTIAHGLGYIPAFVIHSQPDILFTSAYSSFGLDGKYMIAPIQPIATDIGSPYYWYNRGTTVWADSTNIYIKLDDDYGYEYSFTDCENNNYGGKLGAFYTSGSFPVGRDGDDYLSGALRFNDIDVTGSVQKAKIGIYIVELGNNSTPVKTWGMDEDNTGDLSGDPMGRTKTTAYIENSRDAGLNTGSTWAYEVTSIFNEIIGRGGWSSGNHMGFLFEDNGSTNDTLIMIPEGSSDNTGFPFNTPNTYLKWLKNDKLTDYRYTIFKNKLA